MARDRSRDASRKVAGGRRQRKAWEVSEAPTAPVRPAPTRRLSTPRRVSADDPAGRPPPRPSRGWERDPDDDRDPYDTGRTAYHGSSAAAERRRYEEKQAYAERSGSRRADRPTDRSAGRELADGTSRAARAIARRVKRAADADGADESGMSALLGAQALHSAGDALVLVALASTVFFDVPLGEARGRVALYLLLTLLPFGLLVPVAGPLLDRFPHGRRNVLAATAVLRAFVAWQLATSLDGLNLFPLALATLVLSRAYGVGRSAALPRVRPPGLTLVAANARMNVASVVAAGLGAAVGGAVSASLGSEWVLRVAAVVFVATGICAIRLPSQVDEDRTGERRKAPRFRLLDGPPHVLQPLVSAVALRALAGFLTIFLAFLLREEDASSSELGIVVGAVVGGQLIGTALASRLSAEWTRRLTTASLALPVAGCLTAAVLGDSVWYAVAAGLTGASFSLSKFSLDASLQSNVPTASTSGAFTKSETALQLAFATGGVLAIALPAVAGVGFALGALIPVAGVVVGQRAKQGLSIVPSRDTLMRRRPVGTGTGVTASTPDEPGSRAWPSREGASQEGPDDALRRPEPRDRTDRADRGGHPDRGASAERDARADRAEQGARRRDADPDRPWWLD